jgi:hypothetical protein
MAAWMISLKDFGRSAKGVLFVALYAHISCVE